MNNKNTLHIGIVGYCNPSELTAYISPDVELPNINNTATAVTTYIKELTRFGYEVSIFTSFSGPGPKYQEFHFGKIHIYIFSRRHVIRPLGLFSRYYMGRRYANVIAKHVENIDILHAQWAYDSALAVIPFAESIPCFCTVRDWCPYIKKLAKGLCEKVYWWTSTLAFNTVIKNKNIHLIANSPYTKERIETVRPELDVDVIPNPILSDRILKKGYPQKTGRFISIATSIDDPRKNILILIQAFYQVHLEAPDARLLLIGHYNPDGPIYKYVRDNSLESCVSSLGVLKQENIFSYLDESSCLVHPALEETFGNILLEAMSRRLVCIGGIGSGAVPHVLGNGNCGLLCNIMNIDSLVDCMKMTFDHSIIDNLIDNATNNLVSVYSSDINMMKTIDLYNHYRG